MAVVVGKTSEGGTWRKVVVIRRRRRRRRSSSSSKAVATVVVDRPAKTATTTALRTTMTMDPMRHQDRRWRNEREHSLGRLVELRLPTLNNHPRLLLLSRMLVAIMDRRKGHLRRCQGEIRHHRHWLCPMRQSQTAAASLNLSRR